MKAAAGGGVRNRMAWRRIIHGRGEEEGRMKMDCAAAAAMADDLDDEVAGRLVLAMTKEMLCCGQYCCWTQTSTAAVAVAGYVAAAAAVSLGHCCRCYLYSVKIRFRTRWKGKACCYYYRHTSKGAKSICIYFAMLLSAQKRLNHPQLNFTVGVAFNMGGLNGIILTCGNRLLDPSMSPSTLHGLYIVCKDKVLPLVE